MATLCANLDASETSAQAEQKDERRRRGDAATQTSDARFDERFQMAHGLLGEAARPWYAKPSLLSEAERCAQGLYAIRTCFIRAGCTL